MTDNETFISEKTGKRFKLYRSFPDYLHITEIIEPKLEVGDWYYSILHGYSEYEGEINLGEVQEIRKASGEVWKKINNEWVKL